ncbi:MAG: ABC transporter permease [Candidatus Bipolaricaulota bacterium]|nr:ABC transporter permease [Candidatus Bipolaricaulota bacterium]
MLRDNIRLALHNILHRRVRSWLTILGIVVGVAAVVALISIGDGMKKSVQEQFEDIGYNTIILVPSGPEGQTSDGKSGAMGRMMGGNQEPTQINLDLLGRLPQVVSYGAMRVETAMVTSENMAGQGFLRVTGLTDAMTDAFNAYFNGFQVIRGHGFVAGDTDVLILGDQVASDLGVSVGDPVQVENTPFTVIGILAPRDTKAGAMTFRNLDTALFVPMGDLEALFGGENKISQALLEIADGTDVLVASTAIKTLYSDLGTPVSTMSAEEMSQRIMGVLSGIQQALTAIAAIALLVGAIGVMNTMYTSVLERTRDIGIMKAVGAKDRDVMALFIIESGLLGIVGGIIGIVVGVGISSVAGGMLAGSLVVPGVADTTTSFAASYSPLLIIGTLAFSALLGALAGALPARRAAKLRPVEALRYE